MLNKDLLSVEDQLEIMMTEVHSKTRTAQRLVYLERKLPIPKTCFHFSSFQYSLDVILKDKEESWGFPAPFTWVTLEPFSLGNTWTMIVNIWTTWHIADDFQLVFHWQQMFIKHWYGVNYNAIF